MFKVRNDYVLRGAPYFVNVRVDGLTTHGLRHLEKEHDADLELWKRSLLDLVDFLEEGSLLIEGFDKLGHGGG